MRIRILAWFVFACVAATMPAWSQQAAAPDLASLMQTIMNGRATADTKKQLDAYVDAHPQDAAGYALRCKLDAAIAERNGSSALESLPDCEKSLALAPNGIFSNYATGDVLYDAGRPAQAIPYYSKAIEFGLTGGGVYWKRCDAYRLTGNLDGALADCKEQVDLTPDDPLALYALGHLQYVRASYADAVVNLTSALTIRPQFCDALYWRGMTYASLAKFAQAEADFTACIEDGDPSPDTYLERGKVRRSLGETAAGTGDIQEAAERYRAAGMNAQAAKAEALLGDVQPAAPAMPDGPIPSLCKVASGPAAHVELCILSVSATCAAGAQCHAITLAFERPFPADPNCTGLAKEGAPRVVVERVSSSSVSAGITSPSALSTTPVMGFIVCRPKNADGQAASPAPEQSP